MTVDELVLALDDYHGDLPVVLRSDTGDTIEDYEDFTLDTRITQPSGDIALVIIF